MVEGAEDLCQIEANDGGRENPINLAVKEDVEITTGAIRNSPTEKLVGLDGAEKGREEGVAQASEDLDFPTGTAVGVEVGVVGINGGFVEDLESERRAGRGIGQGVVDEEDSAHATLTEDFE